MKGSESDHRRLSLRSPLKKNMTNFFKTKEEASFPVGYNNFKDMVTDSRIFVDKTQFIQDIIDSKKKAMVITRPRRWGKSLNMSMLYYFLNKEVYKNGKPIVPQPNRVLFEGEDLKGNLEDSK